MMSGTNDRLPILVDVIDLDVFCCEYICVLFFEEKKRIFFGGSGGIKLDLRVPMTCRPIWWFLVLCFVLINYCRFVLRFHSFLLDVNKDFLFSFVLLIRYLSLF